MVVAWAGAAIGSTAVESLFFARYGPRNLPFMYVIVGLVVFPATLAMTAVVARWDRRRALVALLVVLCAVVLALRALLLFDARWVYPPLWLVMMIVWSALGIVTWGLAGVVHDTRQAKRLFPLYGAGAILGGALGGILTQPLAEALHAENLLLVWGISLGGAFVLAASVGGRARRRRRRLAGPRPKRMKVFDAAFQGARFVRRSPLTLWMSVTIVLLNLLYFCLALPFAKAATERFDDPDRLAGFLGFFTGAANGLALLLSLALANRLFARLGVPTVILTYPAIFAIGFAAVAVSPGFAPIVTFRFVQWVWMYGVWTTGWQALRGVIPSEWREQVRAFLDGGPMQLGVVLAGVLLLATQDTLSTRHFFLVAAGLAAAAVWASWLVRRSYAGALVDALRAGWPEVFIPEDEPLKGLSLDQAGSSALAVGVRDPDPLVRRIAIEIVAELPAPAVVDVPVDALRDPDPGVRLAALRAVERLGRPGVLEASLELLHDPDPTIRAAAADAAVAGVQDGAEVADRLRPLLADPNVVARVRAATAMVRAGDDPDARTTLVAAARSSIPEGRAAAVAALGELRLEPALLVDALADDEPSIRRAAAGALLSFGPAQALEPLIDALADEDPTVRDAVEDALVDLGPEVAEPVARALDDHRREATALAVLVRLPNADAAILRAYAETERQRALHYHRFWQVLTTSRDDRVSLLVAGLRHRALRHAEHAVHALAPMTDHAAVDLAIQDLASRDPNQRANALETVEALSEHELVRPLVPIWEPMPIQPWDPGVIPALLEDDDPWIRACAAFAAGRLEDPDLREPLRALAEHDADQTVREAANRALGEDASVETLSRLPIIDRVLALQQVPLFRELSPADLKHVAERVTENVYVDGTVIAEQDDPGDAMHVVVSGEIRVLLRAGDDVSEVARRGPGYIVGEMSVLSEQPRMANLVAVGDVRTLSIDRRRFQRILRERPDAALAVMRELSARLREAHGQLG
jgi:HEAT repeat protein/predicted MFS family arabinose efflux permease